MRAGTGLSPCLAVFKTGAPFGVFGPAFMADIRFHEAEVIAVKLPAIVTFTLGLQHPGGCARGNDTKHQQRLDLRRGNIEKFCECESKQTGGGKTINPCDPFLITYC